jgi:3-hydroxyisobutyrate dehydrogenase
MTESNSKPRVAILGLGNMGAGMAGRLLQAGFPLTVYNRNREKAAQIASAGARAAESPREAAEDAEIIVSMVADDSASREIWLGEKGVLAGVTAGTALVECSTLTVDWVRELAALAKQKGCELVDAPVTGSKPQAAAGELLFLAGGTSEAIAKAQPALLVMGRGVVHLGTNGSGALLKLINNFLCGVQAASFAEAASMIRAGRLDSEKALSVLTNGAPGSPLVKTISARAVANDPAVNFSLRLMAKDLGYAIEAAKRNGVSLQTAAAALEIFQRSIVKGYGEKDMSAIITAQQSS